MGRCMACQALTRSTGGPDKDVTRARQRQGVAGTAYRIGYVIEQPDDVRDKKNIRVKDHLICAECLHEFMGRAEAIPA